MYLKLDDKFVITTDQYNFVLNELKEGILQEFSSPLKISSRKIGFAYLSSILRENPAVQQFMQDGM